MPFKKRPHVASAPLMPLGSKTALLPGNNVKPHPRFEIWRRPRHLNPFCPQTPAGEGSAATVSLALMDSSAASSVPGRGRGGRRGGRGGGVQEPASSGRENQDGGRGRGGGRRGGRGRGAGAGQAQVGGAAGSGQGAPPKERWWATLEVLASLVSGSDLSSTWLKLG